MLNRLVTVVVAISTLASLGLLVLFARSFWIADEASLLYRPRAGPVEYRSTFVISQRGVLRAHIGTPTEMLASQPSVPLGWQRASDAIGAYATPVSWKDLAIIVSVADEAKGDVDT